MATKRIGQKLKIFIFKGNLKTKGIANLSRP
jgi:hypothetical protein